MFLQTVTVSEIRILMANLLLHHTLAFHSHLLRLALLHEVRWSWNVIIEHAGLIPRQGRGTHMHASGGGRRQWYCFIHTITTPELFHQRCDLSGTSHELWWRMSLICSRQQGHYSRRKFGVGRGGWGVGQGVQCCQPKLVINHHIRAPPFPTSSCWLYAIQCKGREREKRRERGKVKLFNVRGRWK